MIEHMYISQIFAIKKVFKTFSRKKNILRTAYDVKSFFWSSYSVSSTSAILIPSS